MRRRPVLLVVAGLLLAGCGDEAGVAGDSEPAVAVEPDVPATIAVTSPAFDEGDTIPEKYTCHGAGDAPVIQWSGLPSDAVSVTVVADDPDAPDGGYVH